jgi:hypothetical protein
MRGLARRGAAGDEDVLALEHRRAEHAEQLSSSACAPDMMSAST